MTERILGPTGSPRRRRWLGVPIVLVFAVAMFWIAGAQAVHDVGVFQLDGDAQEATGDTSQADDWDVICKANSATCTFQGTLGTGVGSPSQYLKKSSHVNDGDLNASIFTGGGSKDPEDTTAWAWKDGAGGLPDKDNLLHAYAARYEPPKSATTCPAAAAATNCTLLYFGADRFANDGDAQMGFWFLQKKLTLDGVKSGGGTSFAGGPHTPGDLLVISDFSNGGTTSTINVFKWVTSGGDAGTHLLFLAGSDDANCGSSALTHPDRFCGIVNPADGTIAPWEYTNKRGRTTFDQGEIYEAGINISDPTINLGGECFSSFVAETRSSTSTTAVLKDFVLGQFESCVPALTTQASDNGTVTPGTAVHDTATITVTGGTNPTDPTGSSSNTPPNPVTFYLCYSATASPACTSGGTLIGTGNLVGGAVSNDGTATAVSPDVNCATAGTGCSTATGVNPLINGYYCFRASWPGDANYGPAANTDNTNECFQVLLIPTEIKTKQSWFPNDTANIKSTVATDNLAASGTVDFFLYDNATCNGTLKYEERQTLTGGTNDETVSTHNYTGSTAKKTDGATTVVPFSVTTDYTDAAGNTTATYSWKVVYTPASGDTTHTGKRSACTTGSTEKFQTTYTNDAGPGTALP